MADSGDREVVFVLKGSVDPGMVQSLRQIGAQTKATQDEINKIEEKTSSSRRRRMETDVSNHKKSLAEKTALEKEHKTLREKFLQEEEVRARQINKKLTTEYDKEQKFRSKILEQNVKYRIREQEREYRHAEVMIRRNERIITTSNQTIISSSRVLLRGFASIGFGLAEIGITSEETGDKILKKLLAIHAAYNFLRGGISLLQGMTRMWNAYAKAVEAAAIAHEALSITQSKGIVASTTNTATSVSKTSATGVSSGLIGGAVGAGGAKVAPSIMGAVIPMATSALGALVGTIWAGHTIKQAYRYHKGEQLPDNSLYMKTARGMGWVSAPWDKFIGPRSELQTGWKAESEREKYLKNYELYSEGEERKSLHTQNILSAFETYSKFREPNESALRKVYSQTYSAQPFGISQENVDVYKLRYEIGEKIINQMEKEKSIRDKTNRSMLDSADDYLKKLETQHEQLVKNAKTLRENALVNLSSLAVESPAEQQKVLSSITAMDAGVASRSQAKIAMQYVAPGKKEQYQSYLYGKIDPRLAAATGWEKEFQDTLRAARKVDYDIVAHNQATNAMVRAMESESRLYAVRLERTVKAVIEAHFAVMERERIRVEREASAKKFREMQ